jgi:hypothetical protein
MDDTAVVPPNVELDTVLFACFLRIGSGNTDKLEACPTF